VGVGSWERGWPIILDVGIANIYYMKLKRIQSYISDLGRLRPVKLSVGILIILLAIGIGIGIRIVNYGQTIVSGSYDCAIVLGAEVNGSIPSPVFQARIDHGIALYQAGIVRHLIFTGGVGDRAQIAESVAARNIALARGIPDRAISVELVSRTTSGNLIESQKIMLDRGLTTAIVVSDPFHLRRSCDMAKDLGIVATPSATPSTRYVSISTQLPFLLREIYFTIHYWILRS
jgi:uncharacterized SAM-binding protein YcdF (DUF218 family)